MIDQSKIIGLAHKMLEDLKSHFRAYFLQIDGKLFEVPRAISNRGHLVTFLMQPVRLRMGTPSLDML